MADKAAGSNLKRDICRLLKNPGRHKSVAEIARSLGVSTGYVYQVAHSVGIDVGFAKRKANENRRIAREMRNKGYSDSEIAKKMDVSVAYAGRLAVSPSSPVAIRMSVKKAVRIIALLQCSSLSMNQVADKVGISREWVRKVKSMAFDAGVKGL